MNLPNLRSRTLFVTQSIYRALEAEAEYLGMTCADELACAWLADRIALDPHCSARTKNFLKHLEAHKKECREMDDQLP